MRPYRLAIATLAYAMAAPAFACLSLWLATIAPHALPRALPMLATGATLAAIGAACCASLAISTTRAFAADMAA